MSNVYYDERKGQYSLPVREEWQEALDLEQSHILSGSRAALTSFEKDIRDAYSKVMKCKKMRERRFISKAIALVVVSVVCLAVNGIGIVSGRALLNSIAFKVGTCIVFTVCVAWLLWHFISGCATKKDLNEPVEKFRIKLMIKEQFQSS